MSQLLVQRCTSVAASLIHAQRRTCGKFENWAKHIPGSLDNLKANVSIHSMTLTLEKRLLTPTIYEPTISNDSNTPPEWDSFYTSSPESDSSLHPLDAGLPPDLLNPAFDFQSPETPASSNPDYFFLDQRDYSQEHHSGLTWSQY